MLNMKHELGWGLPSLLEAKSASCKQQSAIDGLLTNAHIHLPPNFSAFESVKQAVEKAASEGVSILGACNYYDFSVYADFAAEVRKHAIFPLYGLEIIALIDELVESGVKLNDPGNPGRMYLCGKGITRFDELSPEALRLLTLIRSNDEERMRKMIALLADLFEERGLDTGLNESSIINMVVQRHGCAREVVYLQERHIAQAFQEALFKEVPGEKERGERLERILGTASKVQSDDAIGIQNEIRSHLLKSGKPAFVSETFLNFEQSYELILQLGGIPCYPTLADGASPICPFEEPVGKLIENMKTRGIHCAEYIPLRNRPDVLAMYVQGVRDAGIVVTAGTEHNTLGLIPIVPACLDGEAIPDEIRAIFLEGAYVVAAHQFLTLHGETGFVDEKGVPNQNYDNPEDRIQAFSAIGAIVVERYTEACKNQ
jgi:hypothetical protein